MGPGRPRRQEQQKRQRQKEQVNKESCGESKDNAEKEEFEADSSEHNIAVRRCILMGPNERRNKDEENEARKRKGGR